MPHVIIKMYPGRSDAQKQRIADLVTKAIMEGAGSSEPSISVSIEDVPAEQWLETVYKPDIAGRPDILFKKPGYNPA